MKEKSGSEAIMKMEQEADLLSLIQKIANSIRNTGSEENMLMSAGTPGQILSAELNCTIKQAIIFSMVFNLNFNTEMVTITDMASFLGCEPINIASFARDLEALKDLKLIRKQKANVRMFDLNGNNLARYFVPSGIIDSVCEKNKLRIIDNQYDSLGDIFAVMNEMSEASRCMEFGLFDLRSEVISLIHDNSKLAFSKAILAQEIGENSILIVSQMSLALSNGNESVNLINLLKDLIPDVRVQMSIKRQFTSEHHELLKKKLVCFTPGSFKGDLMVKLTDKFVSQLFEGEQDLLQPDRSRKNAELILHEIISEKTMFYSGEEARNLQFIEEALMPVNFRKLMKKLSGKGLPQGVNILFYGPPGTGKTESVLQLARRTGRDIRQIDISETKSSWFGESEKIIKQVFDQYRMLVNKSKITPILFFNEADGIFARRKMSGKSSTDQTENAIQNIILQEMETLRGILIATTNMAGNLDKAFERRFLYKILFEKPNMEARYLIWETRLPELEKDFIRYLSERFDFTEGQIDNIIRKYIMHQIIRDKDPGPQDIINWCREENLQEGYHRVGFKM